MKKYVILAISTLLTLSCNSQEKKINDDAQKGNKAQLTEEPKGTWKVNREFDEEGNLIRYDSVYSWSSGTDLNELAAMDRDSILKSMQSRFYRNFSHFEHKDFPNLFEDDSLFTKRFFNDDFFQSDFGHDFMDIDKVRERMENMQRNFLERYGADLYNQEKKDEE